MSRIVVGVDGSPEAKEALRWAVEEARLRGAALRVVHAWEFPLGAVGPGVPALYNGEFLQTLRLDAEQLVDRLLAETDPGATIIETAVVEGPAAQTLIAAAEGAELLVVGSRGRGGFTGLLLGSVSQQCAHHAPCPVVIVRAPRASAR